MEYAKEIVSRYFSHQKIQISFLKKRGGDGEARRGKGSSKQTALNTVDKIWRVLKTMQRLYLFLHIPKAALFIQSNLKADLAFRSQ